MKIFQTTAAVVLAALMLGGCVDERRGYSGYSGYSGYTTNDYRPTYRERIRREDRRYRSERRDVYERRRERVYRDRVEQGVDYRNDNEGPNVIRLPQDSGGY